MLLFKNLGWPVVVVEDGCGGCEEEDCLEEGHDRPGGDQAAPGLRQLAQHPPLLTLYSLRDAIVGLLFFAKQYVTKYKEAKWQSSSWASLDWAGQQLSTQSRLLLYSLVGW